MQQDVKPVAYKVHVGQHDFYLHPACLEEIERRNVNSLTQAQLDADRKGLTPVFFSEVPAGMTCHFHECHKPIIEEQKMNPLEGIDGFHNQIGGYSCPNCHDQGCYMCLDASQLQD